MRLIWRVCCKLHNLCISYQIKEDIQHLNNFNHDSECNLTDEIIDAEYLNNISEENPRQPSRRSLRTQHARRDKLCQNVSSSRFICPDC